MKRFRLAIILVLTASPLFATYGKDNPRLQKLYSTFMSPCCWQQNLTLHDSPIAQQLREAIQIMVKEGHSDEEIKALMVQRYTKRILALPDGPERVWLMLTPWLASLTGLFGLLSFLRRLQWDSWSARLADPCQCDKIDAHRPKADQNSER